MWDFYKCVSFAYLAVDHLWDRLINEMLMKNVVSVSLQTKYSFWDKWICFLGVQTILKNVFFFWSQIEDRNLMLCYFDIEMTSLQPWIKKLLDRSLTFVFF